MDLFISVDVETDGPCPLVNSMLSLGACLFTREGVTEKTFSVNLAFAPDAKPNPQTMEWWAKQPASVWEAMRKDLFHPRAAMIMFGNWLKAVCGEQRPIFAAYPAGFDFTFVSELRGEKP